jgi:hypothetical protein
MPRRGHTEEQILRVLRQAKGAAAAIQELTHLP